MNEKRIIAATGAVGASCMAASTVLMGVGLGAEVDQAFKVMGFALGAVGTFLTAGIAYYKGAMAA
jgi:hypothetical protein